MARVRAGAAAHATPQRIDGRYVVEALLGRGGMGSVYRVHDTATDRRIALKRMAVAEGDDETSARLRFRREFHTMASLRHPRIVEVFDYGVDEGTPYYTLELLDGEDLADLDRVTPHRACELLRDVATALAFLHARRLIHRDLASRNVRCTSDGRAKLIDFGVLATAGVTGDVAGTPPYIAPEMVRGRPLDHRADLFGLGALAYRIVAGRHAFPARTVEQLEVMWRERPAPPSSLGPDIPQALDELVLSLLAAEPLARPGSAAEVIDRLTVIGGLDRIAEIEVTHGWLASAALVGRQREMAQIRRAIGRAVEGAGRSLVIEAPSGTGKSRMLRELGLEAQLAGVCVVRGDSDAADRGPYGVIHELARALLAAAPDDADAAAGAGAPMLARVITSMRARYRVTPAVPAGDPAEDRMRLQAELVRWFLAVAVRRPIALLVDDVQRCDEASAAVLAALAHEARRHQLVVAVALRTDEAVRAPAAIASFTDAGQRMRLRGLDESQLGELCRSLFGAAPHIPRLARWMHRVAGGSPFYSIELARHLVDTSVIRYVDGLWVIPDEPGREDLPRGLAEAMDARIAAVPPEIRALGEALAVHGGALPLARIVELADAAEPEQVFAALDRLCFDEILIQTGDAWQFRHDGLREAFVRGIGPERRTALHRRVGEALAAGREAGASREVEIGWHLLRGGEEARGAALLERAGRALYHEQSFSDCIAPLEAVLEVLERRRRGSRAHLEVLEMLLMAGCMADRKTALRHAEPCIAAYRRAAGADLATRAGKYVGRYAGVALGLLWALLRWLFGLCRGMGPYEAFRTFFIVVGYASTIHSLGFDLARSRGMIDLVEPVAILPNRIPYAVYLLTCNLYHFPRGELEIARRNARRLLDILEHDRLTPIREIDRRTGGGGARYMLALIAVNNHEPDVEAEIAALRQLGLRFFEAGADQARIIHLRMRGEEPAAAELEGKVELAFVQMGSIWQVESFMPAISTLAYGNARDILGLRRTIEQLAAMCAEGFRYEWFLALARGEYLRERGDAAAALVELEPVAAHDAHPLLQVSALPALAETLLVLGDYRRAHEVATRAVAKSSNPELSNLYARIRSIRVLALAEAALGDHAAAATRLDDAIRTIASLEHPVLGGGLHEARARVAAAAGDAPAFDQHLAETERLFRASRNQVLFARAERLGAVMPSPSRPPARTAAGEATVVTPPREPVTQPSSPGAGRRQHGTAVSIVGIDAVTTPPPADPRAWVSAVLSGCRGSAERAARALQFVIEETGAASGYLYLRRSGDLDLAAPTFGDEPPTVMRRELIRALGAGTDTIVERAKNPEHEESPWSSVPLVFEINGESIVVGVVAVIAGAIPLATPDPRVLAEVARELFEAGDVTYTRVPG